MDRGKCQSPSTNILSSFKRVHIGGESDGGLSDSRGKGQSSLSPHTILSITFETT